MVTAIIAAVQFPLITWLWWIQKHLCILGMSLILGTTVS